MDPQTNTPAPNQDTNAPAPEPPPPTETPAAPETPPSSNEPFAQSVVSVHQRSYKKLLLLLALLLALAAGGYYYWQHRDKATPVKTYSATSGIANTSTGPTPAVKPQGLQLDPSKNYGNKYAGGNLPVGDGKYETTGAKQGYVYACTGYARNLGQDPGGASSRGPWFNGTTSYNLNKKAHVSGSVAWQSSFSDNVSGSVRTIISNGLPSHTTGVYPIQASDPAYQYDRNPNRISAQSLRYALSANPAYGSPNCMGGQVGIMLTGIPIFSGFDAGGRDAGAWEVQDSCSGHPERTGQYHYHTLSSCIKDTSVQTVIGFALDGFPITGPRLGPNNILTSSDLDECHGIVSAIKLDGKTTTSYHYVMTQDFPYSVSCFRSKPIQIQPAH